MTNQEIFENCIESITSSFTYMENEYIYVIELKGIPVSICYNEMNNVITLIVINKIDKIFNVNIDFKDSDSIDKLEILYKILN